MTQFRLKLKCMWRMKKRKSNLFAQHTMQRAVRCKGAKNVDVVQTPYILQPYFGITRWLSWSFLLLIGKLCV